MSVFFKDQWAKLWNVTAGDNYADLRITTSEKDKEGNYVNSTWFPRVWGDLAEQFKHMQAGDRFKIVNGKVSNLSKKMPDGKLRSFIEFRIFSISDVTSKDGGEVQSNPVDGGGSEDMPY